jgi:L-alanine-DL-glutamate epimerase-like enolase superfamily enzyme
MKITRTETAILRIPEDDPLADMPEEAGRLRPIVILRIQTDSGIEGIGLIFYGGALTGTLRSAVDELCALIDIGHRVADVGLFWLEDVTTCDDYAGLARVNAALSTPIAGGEYV